MHCLQTTGYKDTETWKLLNFLKINPHSYTEDLWYLKHWSSPWSWGGIRDSLDILLGAFVLCDHIWHERYGHMASESKLSHSGALIGEKMGGMRAGERTCQDMNNLFGHDLFCKSIASDNASFDCDGCRGKSNFHTCPHEIMQVFGFGHLNSECP